MKLKSAMIFFEFLLLSFLSGSFSNALENSSVLCANKIYDTELTLKDARWIAERSDLLIISGVGDEYVQQMTTENPDIKIFRYFTVCLISSGSYPFYNVTGYEYVKDNHPDWLLTDSTGKEVHPSTQLYGMDPASPGWAEYWLKEVLEVVSPLPYDGVHGDLAYIDIGNTVPEAKHKYPREEDFHRVQERYLATLHRRLNREGKLLILNNAKMASRTDPDYLLNSRIDNCDGFNQQAFVMRWRNHPESRFINAERLARGMEIIDECAHRKKIVMLGMQPSPDRNEISYCVCCYLLMKNDPWVYLNIDWAGKYENVRRLFREFGDILRADYGVPTGPRYKDGDLWKRDYSKGVVVVDPIGHTFDFIPESK